MLIEQSPYAIKRNGERVAVVLACGTDHAMRIFRETISEESTAGYTPVKLLRCLIFFRHSNQPSGTVYAETLTDALEEFHDLVNFEPVGSVTQLPIIAALADPPQ